MKTRTFIYLCLLIVLAWCLFVLYPEYRARKAVADTAEAFSSMINAIR